MCQMPNFAMMLVDGQHDRTILTVLHGARLGKALHNMTEIAQWRRLAVAARSQRSPDV